MLEWAQSITEATDGRLKVTVYPGSALGFKDADMLRVCGEQGTIEMFAGYHGYVMQDEPSLGLIIPSMGFKSKEDVVKVATFWRPLLAELYAKHNVRVLSHFLWNFSSVHLVMKGPWNSFDQLQGKKVRGWEAAQADTFNKLGMAGAVLPQAELYLAMKTGIFDAGLHTTNGVVVLSLYEVADYCAPLYPPTDDEVVAVNEDAFKSLPADIQEIVINKSEEWTATWVKMTEQPWDAEWDIKAAEMGITILPEFSAEDKAALVKASMEVWKERGVQYGGEVLEYQSKVEAEMKRLGLL